MAKKKKAESLALDVTKIQADTEPAKVESVTALQVLSKLEITSTEQGEQVAALVRGLREKRKAVEVQASSILDPLKATIKAVKAVFDPITDSYEAAERAGTAAIGRANAARAAAEREALALAAASPSEHTEVLLALPEQAIALPQASHTVVRETATVKDAPKAREALARLLLAGHDLGRLLVIDEVELRRLDKAMAAQIPGVEIVRTESVVVR